MYNVNMQVLAAPHITTHQMYLQMYICKGIFANIYLEIYLPPPYSTRHFWCFAPKRQIASLRMHYNMLTEYKYLKDIITKYIILQKSGVF